MLALKSPRILHPLVCSCPIQFCGRLDTRSTFRGRLTPLPTRAAVSEREVDLMNFIKIYRTKAGFSTCVLCGCFAVVPELTGTGWSPYRMCDVRWAIRQRGRFRGFWQACAGVAMPSLECDQRRLFSGFRDTTPARFLVPGSARKARRVVESMCAVIWGFGPITPC